MESEDQVRYELLYALQDQRIIIVSPNITPAIREYAWLRVDFLLDALLDLDAITRI